MSSLLSQIEQELSLPSPLQCVAFKGRELWIKRDDLIHPAISGNKWRKLKYHIKEYEAGDYLGLVTVGGAFSNHLAAVAALGQLAGIKTIGLVSHFEIDEMNPILKECQKKGMHLLPIGRMSPVEFIQESVKFKDMYYVPPGGADALGVSGMRGFVDELNGWCPGTVVAGVGYGAMLKGLDTGLPDSSKIIGVTSFDKGRSLQETKHLLGPLSERVSLDDRFKSWGFGRYKSKMIETANRFYRKHDIILDPIYTVKVAAFLDETIDNLRGPVLMIHSGGIQGWKGFRYRFSDKELPVFLS